MLRSHFGENVPHLHARPVIKARLSQTDHGPVEEEFASFYPELPEAELLVVLVIQARALHFQSERIKVGLANVPQARVGPGPREDQRLRLLRIYRRFRREALLHLTVFIEHIRHELNRTCLRDAAQLHVQSDLPFPSGCANEDIGHPRLG